VTNRKLRAEAPPIERLVELSNDDVRLSIRPEKGCDISSLYARRAQVEMLWCTPWGIQSPRGNSFTADSRTAWIQSSGGGWNLLLPNTGPARNHNGAPFGFHGEAALVPWKVDGVTPTQAEFSVTLATAPLHVHRIIRLENGTVFIDETITNQSPDSTSFSWGHHPAFGHDFITEGTRILIPGAIVELDSQFALNGSPGGTTGAWPDLGRTDLSVVPSDREPRAILAYLSDLKEGSYQIFNDKIGLGVEVRWPINVFPYLWLWQELYGTSGFPWFRRTYALALEPQSIVPESGEPPITLEGGESISVTVSASVITLPP